ncbi:hypothetical protein FACS1894208_01010 [Clostridia bacterium]|nr:hypothetical protein FACS1894208_01010 [Clostridia bacterium]
MRKRGWIVHACWGTGVTVILAAAVVVVVMVFGRIADYEIAIAERDTIIDNLSVRWESLGPSVTGLALTKGVVAGQEINAENWSEYFQEVTYPERLNLLLATPSDFNDVKYIRASLREGAVLTQDDLLTERMEDSLRFYDVILDEYPVGLLPGKYVDVRIRFPFGQDFIALSHKRVEQLNGTVLKFIFSEQDIYTYNSMLTDKILYEAQLYVTEYIDSGSQQSADQFYPLNYNQQELLLKNPNALNIVREEMRLSRELLEAEMLDIEPADFALKQAYYLQLQSQLAALRSSNSSAITGQQALFLSRWEADQRAAAESETGGGGGEATYEDFGPVR